MWICVLDRVVSEQHFHLTTWIEGISEEVFGTGIFLKIWVPLLAPNRVLVPNFYMEDPVGRFSRGFWIHGLIARPKLRGGQSYIPILSKTPFSSYVIHMSVSHTKITKNGPRAVRISKKYPFRKPLPKCLRFRLLCGDVIPKRPGLMCM